MAKYAAETTVSSDRSIMEIRSTLARYDASNFGYVESDGKAMIVFEAHGRRVRFVVPLPSRTDPEFHKTPAGRRTRDDNGAYKAWEQATRQRWRALALAIKAKLEAVETGITTFEEEFLAHIVLPNGETVGQWMGPQIATAYKSEKMPPLLLGVGGAS